MNDIQPSNLLGILAMVSTYINCTPCYAYAPNTDSIKQADNMHHITEIITHTDSTA